MGLYDLGTEPDRTALFQVLSWQRWAVLFPDVLASACCHGTAEYAGLRGGGGSWGLDRHV